MRDRLTERVIRNYRIVAHEDFIVRAEQAINPADNLPFFVVHVDPNQPAGTGAGTYENPYSQLAQFDNLPFGPKSNVDIVFVHPNVDGSSTNLDAGVTMLSDQRLLSSAVPNTFTAVQGTFDLPGYVPTDLPPLLTNASGGNVVSFATGAQNIEVAGFTIQGSATGNGIYGLNNQEININRNTLENGANGVLLQNLSGTAAAGLASIIDQNNFINNYGEGFLVDNTATAPLEIALTRNTAYGNIGDGFAFTSRNGSFIGGVISGNSTNLTDPTTQLQNLNNGLSLFADNGTIDFADSSKGWQIGGTDTGTDDDLLNDANDFSLNGNSGINVFSTNGSTVSTRLINNDLTGNTVNGFHFGADSGQSFITIGGSDASLGNRIENNGLNGIGLNLLGGALAQLDIENNTITSNGNNGTGSGGGGSGGVGNFRIDLNFTGGLTNSQESIFALAAQKWESILRGAVSIPGVDVLTIDASGQDIDGVGGILGQAGPTTLRPVSFLPSDGMMQFDTADLAQLETSGQLIQVIEHEMAHVIGFGTIWTDLNLITGAGTNDPEFTGANAVREYDARFNTNAPTVPLENTGGAGTADSHWRETVFNNELMTGFINPGNNPISRITVGQFQDEGYIVNYAKADPYLMASYPGVTIPIGQVLTTTATVGNSLNNVQNLSSLVEVGDPVGDGINITLADNAVLDPSLIANNAINLSARHGLFVDTADNSSLPNLQVTDNTFNGNGTGTVGSGIFFQREDASTFNANVARNTFTDNIADGWTINAFGAAAPPMNVTSADNTFNGNLGHGTNFQTGGSGVLNFVSNRDTYTVNGAAAVNLNAVDASTLNAVFHNNTINDSTADGVNIFGGDNAVLNVTFDSPADPLFTGTQTTIDGNLNGIVANINNSSFLTLDVFDTSLQNNTQDGANLNRSGSSLILANFTRDLLNGNGDDGLEFNTTGGNPSVTGQPMVGTANQLNLLNSQLNGNGGGAATNGGNGLEVSTRADSVLVVDATFTTFNSNAGDGVRAFSGDASSFGGSAGNRSTFDAVQMGENGGNGMRLLTMSNNAKTPNMFVEVNANSGSSFITDNGGSGIGASAPTGNIDLLVQGDTVGPANFMTGIQRNGGDGIQMNVAGLARDGSDNAFLAYEFRNQSIVDLRTTNAFVATGTLTVDNVIVGDGNSTDSLSDGNGGNGIQVYNGNSDLMANEVVAAGLNINYFTLQSGNANLYVNSSIVSGNALNGILVDSEGKHSYSPFGFFPQGNYLDISVTNSQLAGNGLAGADFEINGMHGIPGFVATDFGGTYSRLESNQIVMDNNDIERNGTYGVLMQANAGQMLRYDYNQNPGFNVSYPVPFWGVFFADPGVTPGNGTVFNPFDIGAQGWPMYQAGFNSDVLLDNYLNITTDDNTNFTFTRNLVQFNGTAESTTADGLRISVSTDSYVSADIGGAAGSGLGNTFNGNVGGDVRLGSFTATDASGTPIQPDPATSIPGDDTAAPPVLDHIELDDTAQLDLRFNNNTGTSMDSNYYVGNGAFYTLSDPHKGGGIRPVQVFQVDDGFNLNANNNWGQDLQDILSVDGNFHLRTVADPLFPNPDFPLNWNEQPADPFLP